VVREYFYVFAAVCPSAGKLTALLLPECNTAMMNLFLQEVSSVYHDQQVIMQLDGAGWHRAKDLNIPANIHLIAQPPYSPELNPVEHIWDDIREKHFCNVFCHSVEQAMDLAMQGIGRLQNNPHYLASLTGFPHLLYPLDC
jgi:transposase